MIKASLLKIKNMGSDAKYDLWKDANNNGRDVKIYLHWTAGHYGQFFNDYHINIDFDGSYYVNNDFAETLAHTWMRNSGSIGIALNCCAGATSDNLGNEPPTEEQIEAMARVITVLADALNLTIDIQRVMTHGEAADNLDGIEPHEPYGPENGCERWDLAILHTGDDWCSGGDVLRGKAAWYYNKYPDGVEKYF